MKEQFNKYILVLLLFFPSIIYSQKIYSVEHKSQPDINESNEANEQFANVNFNLKKGEILGFAGLVGAGRVSRPDGLPDAPMVELHHRVPGR